MKTMRLSTFIIRLIPTIQNELFMYTIFFSWQLYIVFLFFSSRFYPHIPFKYQNKWKCKYQRCKNQYETILKQIKEKKTEINYP